MSIPFSLLAKTLGGVAAVATPVATGVVYREKIKGLFISNSTKNGSEQKTEKNPIEIIKKLGITDKENKKQNGNNYWDLDLSSENLKKLKLLDTNGENTVEGLNSETVKLKIESIDNDFFPEGFKFTLTSSKNEDVKIKKTINNNEQTITLKKDQNMEFKLKDENNSYSLEKLLSEEEIKTNLKLNCGNDNSCTIQENQKINVKNGDKKVENVTFKTDQSNSKIKFEKYKKGYKDGFKFSVDSDIDLQKDGESESGTLDPNKLLQSATYEAIEEGGKWFLSKKITS